MASMRITPGWFGLLAAGMSISIAAAGCGGGSADGRDTTSDPEGEVTPPPSSKLSDLSDGQAAAFCEDLALRQGGYGRKTRTLTCGEAEVTLSFDLGATEAECKASWRLPPACSSLTVGQITSCVQDIQAATCEAKDTPSCDPFLACAGGASRD
jgi:hypothetical protein